MKLYFDDCTRAILAAGVCGLIAFAPAPARAQISLTNGSPTYTQNFNTLPVPAGAATITEFSWANDSTLSGWYMFDNVVGAVVRLYAAGHVTDNTGITDTESQLIRTGSGRPFSFGSPATSTDRALGTIVSSTKGPRDIGLRMKNNGSSAISSLAVSYTGEQWGNQNTTTNTLSFSYKGSASPITTLSPATVLEAGYTAVSALDFVSLQSGGAASNVIDGNLGPNRTALSSTISSLGLAVGSEIMFRWHDADDTGSDAALAIDDLTVTATFAAGVDDWDLY